MRSLACQRKRIFAWWLTLSCLGFGPTLYAQEAAIPAPAPSESTAPLSKGTVLRVNDDGVTSTDVINPIGEQLQTLASRLDRREFLSPVSRARKLITQSAAERVRSILLYQYAKKQLEKNENFEMAIETQMAERRKEFLARHDGSEARAREELAKYGASIEDQFKELERSLIVSVYQETYIMPSLEVTRSQMMRYYKKHQHEKYYQKSKIQFQLIDIQASKFLPGPVAPPPSAESPPRAGALQRSPPRAGALPEAIAQAQEAAQKARQKLHNGSDFAAVVKEYSNGYRKIYDGLWRPIDPEALQEQYQPLINALETIEVGQTTEVIETDTRYFIAKLIDREQERMVPFSEVQSEIDQILRAQLLAKRNKKMIDDLLKKATVGNLELFINDVHHLAWDLLKNSNRKTQNAK